MGGGERDRERGKRREGQGLTASLTQEATGGGPPGAETEATNPDSSIQKKGDLEQGQCPLGHGGGTLRGAAHGSAPDGRHAASVPAICGGDRALALSLNRIPPVVALDREGASRWVHCLSRCSSVRLPE